MTFQRLAHGPVVAPGAMYIINKAEEYLGDVHTFLKLPHQQCGYDAGGNYSIALVLFGVIDGASKTLYPIQAAKSPVDPGKSEPPFVTLLTDYYPWDDEPDLDAVKGKRGAQDLYYCFRNPLTHSLASRPPDDPEHRRARIYKVEKYDPGFTEDLLVELEQGPGRLEMSGKPLSATVRHRASDDVMVILLESLYWGVRRMLENLTHDSSVMQKAEDNMPISM